MKIPIPDRRSRDFWNEPLLSLYICVSLSSTHNSGFRSISPFKAKRYALNRLDFAVCFSQLLRFLWPVLSLSLHIVGRIFEL